MKKKERKQAEALEVLKPNTKQLTIKDAIPENILSEEAKNKPNKINRNLIGKTVDREILVYRTNEYTYDFRNFLTINTFGREIYNGKITLKEADEDQSSVLVEIMNFKKKAKPQIPKKKEEKKDILKNLYPLLSVEKKFSMLLIAKYIQ